MKISVITVNRNHLEGLQKTFQSIVAQTYKDWEWIVIDGGSTDGDKDFIEAHQAEIAYWCSEPDKGPYNAMNKALQHATGDYLVFMNAGDFFPADDTLEQVVRRCRLTELPTAEWPAVLYGNTDIVDAEGRYLHPRRLQPPEQLTWRSFRMGMVVCHQAFYARTDIAKNVQYDTRYRFSADVDWCIRIMREAERLSLPLQNIGIVVANYMEEGATTSNHQASLFERYQVMQCHYGPIQTILLHGWFVVRGVVSKIKAML